jgi:hypothetical protein
VSSQDELRQSDLFPPLLNSVDVVVPCLFSCHFIMPVPSRGQSDAKGVESVHLKVIFEVFKHSDEGERGPPIAVEQHKMWQCGVSHCVELMNMLIFIDADVSELEIDVEFKVGELKSLLIDLDKFFSHDDTMLNSGYLFLHKAYFQAFFLHFYFFIKLSVHPTNTISQIINFLISDVVKSYDR